MLIPALNVGRVSIIGCFKFAGFRRSSASSSYVPIISSFSPPRKPSAVIVLQLGYDVERRNHAPS
jgi:hypothetical protein